MTQKGRVGSRNTAPTQSATYAGAIVAAGSREVLDHMRTAARRWAVRAGSRTLPLSCPANAPQRAATAASGALPPEVPHG